MPDSRRWVGRTKTPWQMLLERRTLAELEVLLDERLRLLRATGEALMVTVDDATIRLTMPSATQSLALRELCSASPGSTRTS